MNRMWRWVILLPVLTFLAGNMSVWPAPRFLRYVALGLVSFPPLTVFVFLFAVPASLWYALTRKWSKSAACLCFIGLWLPALWWGDSLRHRAFVRASQVGDQIVQGLAQYRDDTGALPEQLDHLCPDYLNELPYTGLIAYPHFTYTKKPSDYELRIDCPSGGINFDTFIYWPSETYPDHIGGNRVERIGKWAYVHE